MLKLYRRFSAETALSLQEVAEEPKKMGPDSLLRQKVKQKRFREGYEDGLSSTHKATSALAFVVSETPVEMLGQYSRCAVVMPWHPHFGSMLSSYVQQCMALAFVSSPGISHHRVTAGHEHHSPGRCRL